MNTYQKLMDTLVAIAIMFLIPVMFFKQISEQYYQYIIYEYTRKLGYELETQGYLSKAMYEDYIHSLRFIDEIFEVHFEHIKRIHEPVYKRDYNNELVFTGEVITYENQTFTEEILNYVYEANGLYKMEKGDTFIITLKSNTRGFLERIVTSTWKAEKVRYVRYSGIVRGYKSNRRN